MRTTVLYVRTLVLTSAFSFITHISTAQSVSVFNGKLEVGAGLGPLFFVGDLGGGMGRGTYFVKDVNLPVTKMAKGFHFNYYPVEWLGLRIAVNHGELEGADSLIKNSGGEELNRKVRNLHFRSKLLEGYVGLEFYPTVFLEKYDGLKGKLRPYGIIGAGLFKYNPQAQYNSPNGTTRWVDLKPLRLEGQGMSEYADRPDYELTQLEVPMGVGFKYYITETMFVGFEVLHRITFTDYVDDVSKDFIDANLYDKYLTPDQSAVANQIYNRGYSSLSRPNLGEVRGNPKNNDGFFSSVLRFGWRLQNDKTPKQMLCPKI